MYMSFICSASSFASSTSPSNSAIHSSAFCLSSLRARIVDAADFSLEAEWSERFLIRDWMRSHSDVFLTKREVCEGQAGVFPLESGSGSGGGVEEGLVLFPRLISLLLDHFEIFAMSYLAHSFSPLGRCQLEFCLFCDVQYLSCEMCSLARCLFIASYWVANSSNSTRNSGHELNSPSFVL